MTLTDYINRRENILSTFECSVDVALKIHEKAKDEEWFISTVKKWHLECTKELENVKQQFINAPKPEDPFVDVKVS